MLWFFFRCFKCREYKARPDTHSGHNIEIVHLAQHVNNKCSEEVSEYLWEHVSRPEHWIVQALVLLHWLRTLRDVESLRGPEQGLPKATENPCYYHCQIDEPVFIEKKLWLGILMLQGRQHWGQDEWAVAESTNDKTPRYTSNSFYDERGRRASEGTYQRDQGQVVEA